MKQGSMLLDVMVGTFIASIVMMMLTNAFSQMTRFQFMVDELSEHALRTTLIYQQLTKDISGIFVPNAAVIPKKEEKKSVFATTKKQEKEPEKKEETEESTAIKPLKKIFYASMTDQQQMQQFTFITNNASTLYWQEAAGTPRPKCARVVYTLEPQEDRADSYALIRTEGTDLDFAAYEKEKGKGVQSHQLVDHIQSLSLSFSYQKEEPAQKGSEGPKTSSPAVQTVAAWDSDDIEQKNAGYISRLPESITISGEFWDQAYKKTYHFHMTVPVLAQGFNAPFKKELKPTKPEKSEAKAEEQAEEKKEPTKEEKTEEQSPKTEEKMVFEVMVDGQPKEFIVVNDKSHTKIPPRPVKSKFNSFMPLSI